MKRKHPVSGGEDSCGSNSSSNGDDGHNHVCATPNSKSPRHECDDHVTDTVGVVVLDRSVICWGVRFCALLFLGKLLCVPTFRNFF
jgi:hypothetical protein